MDWRSEKAEKRVSSMFGPSVVGWLARKGRQAGHEKPGAFMHFLVIQAFEKDAARIKTSVKRHDFAGPAS